MRIVFFLTKAFLAGIVFSCGAYFGLIYLLPASGLMDDVSYYREYVEDIESGIGKPCLRVHADAVQFVENDVNQIIEAGVAGDDWVAVITPAQKTFIDNNDDWLMDCDLASEPAKQIGEDWPEFTDLQRLFSTLRTFSTSYGDHPVSAERLLPEAFEMLQDRYRKVTSSQI